MQPPLHVPTYSSIDNPQKICVLSGHQVPAYNWMQANPQVAAMAFTTNPNCDLMVHLPGRAPDTTFMLRRDRIVSQYMSHQYSYYTYKGTKRSEYATGYIVPPSPARVPN